MANSKYIIAAAGSGKTTYLVNEALAKKDDEQVLITTFTIENEKEIKRKFIKKHKAIPSNVTIQTWWSFLMQHGVKPYQNMLTDKDIKGLLLVNSPSGLIRLKGKTFALPEKNVDKHYFSSDRKIYSDKIAKFVIRSSAAINGAVFDRISNIYDYIFIDEAQDLVGYDLDIINELVKKTPVTIVGDPRQVTFQTHHSLKNKKYAGGNLEGFINDKMKKLCDITPDMLDGSYRCNQAICDFSSTLFPNSPAVKSLNKEETKHDGIFIISSKDIDTYMKMFSPVQLRFSRKSKVHPDYEVYNFGESKGLTFDRSIIYPTKTIKDHLSEKKKLTGSSLCKFYVALTRARFSTAIVWDTKEIPDGCSEYVLF